MSRCNDFLARRLCRLFPSAGALREAVPAVHTAGELERAFQVATVDAACGGRDALERTFEQDVRAALDGPRFPKARTGPPVLTATSWNPASEGRKATSRQR